MYDECHQRIIKGIQWSYRSGTTLTNSSNISGRCSVKRAFILNALKVISCKPFKKKYKKKIHSHTLASLT